MHPKHLFVAAIAAAALTSSAQAAPPAAQRGSSKLYGAANLGLTMFHDNDVTEQGASATVGYKSGIGFTGALGYIYDPRFRFEGEIAYRKNKIDNVGGTTISGFDMTVWSYMINGYYDFATVNLPVKPFVGLGLGLASGKVKGPTLNQSDSELAYQGILGLSYPFDPNGSVSFQYRYHSAQDFSKNGVSFAYGSSNFLVGILYAFSI